MRSGMREVHEKGEMEFGENRLLGKKRYRRLLVERWVWEWREGRKGDGSGS